VSAATFANRAAATLKLDKARAKYRRAYESARWAANVAETRQEYDRALERLRAANAEFDRARAEFTATSGLAAYDETETS
jgi:hypothetical protein